jgi:hypothetical protein
VGGELTFSLLPAPFGTLPATVLGCFGSEKICLFTGLGLFSLSLFYTKMQCALWEKYFAGR